MQAIITKYHAPSNVRGGYVSAKCEAISIRVQYDDALSVEDNHREACRELCRRMDKRNAKLYGSKGGSWSMDKVSGQIPSGEYIHFAHWA